MPYVARNPEGRIESLHRQAAEGAQEFLPDDHAEVLGFVGRKDVPGFVQLDADFVRVIEDVIDTLIVKNVINITDLPAEAQAKLLARKSFRERVARHSLRLFGETEGGDVIHDTGFGTPV